MAGRPLADLEFEPFARLDVERLSELRLTAVEKRIEAELSLGRHAMLVPELEARVAEHPLRERLRAQLMLALYRCGRQADALGAYRAGRALLNEELALEPSPVLRQLEQSILRQEAALELSDPGSGSLATQVIDRPAQVTETDVPDLGGEVSQGCRKYGRPIVLALVLGFTALVAGALAFALNGSRTSPLPPTASG